MSDKTKKKILLNKAGALPETFLGFMLDAKIEVIDEIRDQEIDYILVKNFDGNFNEIEQLYQTTEKNIQIISIAHLDSIESFFQCNGKAILDPTWIKSNIGNEIFLNYFNGRSSIHLDEMYGNVLKEIKMFKMTNHLRLGHYNDILSTYATQYDFNVIGIRSFLENSVYFCNYLRESNVASWPCEVEFGFSSESFIVQLHVPVKNFVMEYLWKSFNPTDFVNPSHHLLYQCANLAHYFDVNYLERATKVVLTGVWLKAEAASELSFPSISVQNIHSTSQLREVILKDIKEIQLAIEGKADDIIDTLSEKKLPGEGLGSLQVVERKIHLDEKSEMIPQLVQYIGQKRMTEENPVYIEELTTEDLDKYLSDHPDQSLVQRLTTKDKAKVLSYLLDPKVLEAFVQSISKAKKKLEESPNWKELYAKKVSGHLVANYDYLNKLQKDQGLDEVLYIGGEQVSPAEYYAYRDFIKSNLEEIAASDKLKQGLGGTAIAKTLGIKMFKSFHIKDQMLVPELLKDVAKEMNHLLNDLQEENYQGIAWENFIRNSVQYLENRFSHTLGLARKKGEVDKTILNEFKSEKYSDELVKDVLERIEEHVLEKTNKIQDKELFAKDVSESISNEFNISAEEVLPAVQSAIDIGEIKTVEEIMNDETKSKIPIHEKESLIHDQTIISEYKKNELSVTQQQEEIELLESKYESDKQLQMERIEILNQKLEQANSELTELREQQRRTKFNEVATANDGEGGSDLERALKDLKDYKLKYESAYAELNVTKKEYAEHRTKTEKEMNIVKNRLETERGKNNVNSTAQKTGNDPKEMEEILKKQKHKIKELEHKLKISENLVAQAEKKAGKGASKQDAQAKRKIAQLEKQNDYWQTEHKKATKQVSDQKVDLAKFKKDLQTLKNENAQLKSKIKAA